jgi:hypothetical protein
MNQKKDYSLINCLATTLIALFITVPGHELLHLLTHMVYGSKLICYSAGAVDATVMNMDSLSTFHKIMVAGGSASIINAILAIILAVILIKAKLGPMLRLFLTQLMGMQAVQGIGYFLIGGLFGAGDWGNVYEALTGNPGLVSAIRIILSVLGCVGIVVLFFFLNYLSYYFIEDKDNKAERMHVAFGLHLIPMIAGFAVGLICSFMSPFVKSGQLSIGTSILFSFMWIPFFWGFMFTGPMKTLPPKTSRFLYKLPGKPNWVLLGLGVVLTLIDIFVFGPGVYFS